MARLFVAATPPQEVLEPLVAAVARGREGAPGLRWSSPDRIHLTLVFLGEVDDVLRDDLHARLARVARRHAPVAAALAPLGRFGDRVLWAGVRGEFAPLVAGVRRAAERAGIEGLDDRPYQAHLTLARAREARGPRRSGVTDLAGVVAALGELPAVEWTVDRLELVLSLPQPDARYVVQEIWELGRD